MECIADLHVHSKYAMACSEQLTIDNIAESAREKGIGLVSTGDFTHPKHMSEIKKTLEEHGTGIYKIKGSSKSTQFVIGTEVCTVFEDRLGRSRRIHHCILAPSIEAAEQANEHLSRFGDLSSDGRPLLNRISPAQLVEDLIGIDPEMFVFPAHLWTPWFGALGEHSGFNSIEEAYEDQAMHIYAYETGLSSDPPMNWRLSKLDRYTPISGSDAHSLPKMGREAIIFDVEDKTDFTDITGRIKKKEMKLTIEFYPEEGKYHFDGHRNCSVSLSPDKSKKFGNRCPKCGKKLTIGVMHRIDDLADREAGFIPNGAVPYVHAIPLQEVIAHVTGKATYSMQVKSTYSRIIQRFGTEFNVLMKADPDSIAEVDKKLAEGIRRIREDKAHVIPGYDGVFGIIDIFNEVKQEKSEGMQKRITEF
jgi:uncharacterized protein (TIGR00375 family)